jgi:integrase
VTLDQLATIAAHMSDRLLIILTWYVGLRQGELLELRRSDVDGVTGRISVARKIDKDVIPGAAGACPNRDGRAISAPKTASGVRTVHVPPPLLPMLQRHLLEHTAAGPTGLLFPGDRIHHMSVRYLMDRYGPAGPPSSQSAGPHDPPPPSHGTHLGRSARRHRRRASDPRRPRLPGRDGDLPTRHA